MTTEILDNAPAQFFTFGDPVPVLNNAAWFDYTGVFLDPYFEYYRPPLDLIGLANLMGANAYHGSIIHFKKNQLVKWFNPHHKLSWSEFEKLALDYLIFGNAYLQKLTNRFGQVTRLERVPAIVMRRHREFNRYVMLSHTLLEFDLSFIKFNVGEIVHFIEPDVKQEIYGVPEYIGGIQSVLLSEDSTLFRRKVFSKNGQHIGYILVTSDAGITDETAKVIEAKIKNSQGPSNMFINIPRTNSREPVKVIPLGSIENKDSYEVIKKVTEREMLAMHRMQPGLSGIIPEAGASIGDLNKAMEVYYELEVTSMQQTFLGLNNVIGEDIISFKQPDWKKALSV